MMPILKQLVSASSQSKRRSRTDLTAEMISAPLDDFRHTMHVGRGGDAFGDTSFLSSRSGEPPHEPQTQQNFSKQGLLSRTFRSSKRSQSVTCPDKRDSVKTTPSTSSTSFVKTAISLPYLNNDEKSHPTKGGPNLPKSVSSSPIRSLPDIPDPNPHSAETNDSELDEQNFGILTDLPVSLAPPYGGGMKHAESILSFHIDLGPSMLGDILSVMDKNGWEDDIFSNSSNSCPLSKPKEENVVSKVYDRNGMNYQDTRSRSEDERTKDHGTNQALDDGDIIYMDEDQDEDEIRV
ncbi:cdc42 effector protein 4-like [Hoplias malabaricus]|uniref:cdc42 effector protein 4-like n=1 Tax=Hoplias malabaricus TaxID=27720 RepID=UPI0034624012